MARGWVYIDEDRCKGCNLCVDACPQHVLALSTDRFNAKGYRPVQLVDPDNCTGCTACKPVCPVNAITGNKKELHVIDQNLCTQCGACFAVCNFDAILVS